MTKTAALMTGVFCIGTASAGSLLSSFSYENLHSSYTSGTNLLTASATLDSTGSVSRLTGPSSPSTAMFNTGSANFTLDITVSNIGATTADGAGTMTATDLNGDTLTAVVDGSFSYHPLVGPIGIIFFDGELNDVFFNDISGDGEFNGDGGTKFSTDFSAFGQQPFFGGIQRLQVGTSGFFLDDWTSELAEVDGQIVPTPGSMVMLGVATLAAARRRRA